MIGPIHSKAYLAVCVMLLLALVMGSGCQGAKPPPSPKAVTFSREVQSVINRIAPPMAGPITQEDREACREGW
jgi:hypothetical protein